MSLSHLQREKSESTAENAEEELWQHHSVPPSTLRTSMVHLTGCLHHDTALLATVNPQTPSNSQTSPIRINLEPNILIWADLRKELHPKTMQDEQLQISWLFTLFCIQEFSAGVDNLNQSFMNKIEHKKSKNKTTRRIEILYYPKNACIPDWLVLFLSFWCIIKWKCISLCVLRRLVTKRSPFGSSYHILEDVAIDINICWQLLDNISSARIIYT